MLIILLLVVSQLIEGNGYETRQTSKGLIKEQTLMLRRDQTQTFSLAHCPIYAEMFLFCAGSR